MMFLSETFDPLPKVIPVLPRPDAPSESETASRSLLAGKQEPAKSGIDRMSRSDEYAPSSGHNDPITPSRKRGNFHENTMPLPSLTVSSRRGSGDLNLSVSSRSGPGLRAHLSESLVKILWSCQPGAAVDGCSDVAVHIILSVKP